ncbi:hypothetical protein [Absidia glauca]|uniref:Uncharacterized protein n=1 Tax=Absidia glauca TaxID=4829 RepID=A0A163K306_ABSGL|nr:hypothetical protein [Absidia glauca]
MTTRFAYVVQDDSPGESDEEGSSVETYQPSIEMADEGMQNRDNTMATILSIINNGPYSQLLSKRQYVELADDTCQMMNDSWLRLPSLRYACSQLLAGSIIINNNNEAIIVNSVEIYGRDRIMDEHRERSVNKEGVPVPSSLPPVPSKYHKTWLFAFVAASVFKAERFLDAKIVDDLVAKCSNGNIKQLLVGVSQLAANDRIAIINSRELNDLLQQLSSLLAPGIVAANNYVAENIKTAFYP